MKSRISRRAITTALAGSPLLAQAVKNPQTPATPPGPATAPTAGTDFLTAARQQVERNSESLSKFSIPMATEPTFVFRP
ncbi:MAG TPA: hypothetical protein VE621_24490 [Bryobacteraceae bacterium]|jgi:hypothetical protein|nr:hypothetical protein [Bryobacteraceae bacterium]